MGLTIIAERQAFVSRNAVRFLQDQGRGAFLHSTRDRSIRGSRRGSVVGVALVLSAVKGTGGCASNQCGDDDRPLHVCGVVCD